MKYINELNLSTYRNAYFKSPKENNNKLINWYYSQLFNKIENIFNTINCINDKDLIKKIFIFNNKIDIKNNDYDKVKSLLDDPQFTITKPPTYYKYIKIIHKLKSEHGRYLRIDIYSYNDDYYILHIVLRKYGYQEIKTYHIDQFNGVISFLKKVKKIIL